MPTIPLNDFLEFVRTREGKKNFTLTQHKEFTVRVVDDGLEFINSKKNLKKQRRTRVQRVLDKFNETGSFADKDYRGTSFHRTYQLPLIRLYLQSLGPAADEAGSNDDPAYSASAGDHREQAWQLIKKRRGKQQFRDALLQRYEKRCLVTGCEVVAVLEAAHIDPYRDEGHNHPGNGLLLRADVHTLFDLDLLGIEPSSLRVELHPDIAKEYKKLVLKTLGVFGERRPLQEALKRRYQLFQKRKQWPA